MARRGRKRSRFNRYNVGSLKMSARVRKVLVPAEKKFLDTALNLTGADNAAEFKHLNDIDQGATASNRIGIKAIIDSISFKMVFDPAGVSATTSVPTSTTCRVVIFFDRQANGSTPGWTDVFKANGQAEFRQLDNTARFRVLYDKIISLNQQIVMRDATNVAICAVRKHVRVNIKLKKGVMTHWKELVDGAAGNIKTNSLWIGYWPRHALPGQAVPLNGNCRIRFTDP